MRTRITIAAVLASLAMGAQAARADMVAALSNDAVLTMIDAKGLKAAKQMKITGVNGRIVGIDVRPADGMLYALTQDGTVYTVDPASGKAAMKVKLETMVPAGAARVTVDFNPLADRLRVMGSEGTNLRANVDDGKVVTDKPLSYAAGDANAGKTPMVVAGAYSNSFKGTKETALYDIDGALGAYLKQIPPNDGILTTLGMVGKKGKDLAFDIAADGKGGNVGYLIADGELHTVDIATGAARKLGPIAGLPKGVRDIAVVNR